MLENVGNGPAISFRLGLHKANESYEDGEYILPIHLKREQTFYVGIYCEDASPIIGKKFKFGKLRICDSLQSVDDASLFDYMRYIYPDDYIVEYESIPNDIISYRTSLYGYSQSKYGITAIRAMSKKHDIRIESQSLIVNILNRSWFQFANRIETTLAQNKYLESIGYRVINIPYYIQLSKEMIQYYFDVEVDRGCEYPSGFYDQEADSFHMIDMYPANFCIYGYKYFLDEYHKYPENVQSDIKQSILDAIFNYGEAAVLPYYEYLCDDLFELDFYPD